jgi:hypothetical protein
MWYRGPELAASPFPCDARYKQMHLFIPALLMHDPARPEGYKILIYRIFFVHGAGGGT